MEEGLVYDAGAGAGGDRLSDLPDCLLHEIMSRLKARQVVQTCVLSTRWRGLWRSVPCLDVDQEEFDTTLAGGGDDNDGSWETFEDFADNLLCHLNIATLDSFRLRLVIASTGRWTRRHSQDAAASRWIRRAIKYSAQAPAPSVHGEGLRYWRLRRLHLCNVLLDGRFMEHVSSGCHFLEDLVLEDCNCASPFGRVASETLKNLVLKGGCSWYPSSEIKTPALKKLVISSGCCNGNLLITAPALADLDLSLSDYQLRMPVSLSLGEMPSLARAVIHLQGLSRMSHRRKLVGTDLDVLRSVSNVTSLELSGFGIMVPGKQHRKFPEFKNLRTLLLNDCDLGDNFKTLGHFLQNSPNLEKLTLRLCKFSSDSEKQKRRMSKSVSPFQCENLKCTEIVYKADDSNKLVELLVLIPRNQQKNHIELTEVD
ncbi:hypothetical protein ACP4OV_020969 [Aristida adscensionis]